MNPTATAAVRSAHTLVPVGPGRTALPSASWHIARGAAPSVSIVVPAHDDGLYLETCLESVRTQGFESWECLIVDDSSLDNSLDIAAAFVDGDERFVAVRQDRNVGLAGTRNTGIARGSGEYLAFLDADDFLFQDSLAVRYATAAGTTEPQIVGSWCDWVAVPEAAGLDFIPPGGEKSGVVDYRTGKGSNQFISTSPLLRTDVVRSLGGFDETFRTAEDFEFWTRLFRNGFALVGTGTVGVAYRQKRVSMVSADPFGHARNASAVYSYMAEPLVAGAVSALATDPFVDPEPGVPSAGSLADRLISFLTFAQLSTDPTQVEGVLTLIAQEQIEGVDVDDAIRRALARHSLRVGGMPNDERERVREIILGLLARPATASSGRAAHRGILDSTRVEKSSTKERPDAVVASVRECRALPVHRQWDVVISGSTSTGVLDLLALGREFVDAGASVAVLDPGRNPAVRQRAHAEGIRVVVNPAGPTGLELSTDGRDHGVSSRRCVVVCAESWLVGPEGDPDLVLARTQWEVELWRAAGHRTELGGWRSRASRLETRGRPRDGAAHRGRIDTVLAVRAPGGSAGPGRDRLLAALGESADLVFGPHLSAPRRELIVASRLPILMASVRAVVVSGTGVPVDALIHGTPVLALAPELPFEAEGLQAVSLDDLPSALATAAVTEPAIADDDWLAAQVSAIKPYLV